MCAFTFNGFPVFPLISMASLYVLLFDALSSTISLQYLVTKTYYGSQRKATFGSHGDFITHLAPTESVGIRTNSYRMFFQTLRDLSLQVDNPISLGQSWATRGLLREATCRLATPDICSTTLESKQLAFDMSLNNPKPLANHWFFKTTSLSLRVQPSILSASGFYTR